MQVLESLLIMGHVSASERIEKDPLLKAVMAEILEIQSRFVPEPVFAKTGIGYLKSEGVFELQQAKLSEANNTRRNKTK